MEGVCGRCAKSYISSIRSQQTQQIQYICLWDDVCTRDLFLHLLTVHSQTNKTDNASGNWIFDLFHVEIFRQRF